MTGIMAGTDWREAIEGLPGSRKPPQPKKPTLLVVDMQRYFLEKGGPAYLGAEEIIPNVQKLLSAFTKAKYPIFATKYSSSEFDGPIEKWWATRLEPDDRWAELDPRICYPEEAEILSKHLYGTFSATDLDSRLRNLGVDAVIICGVMTHLCCETTAREAFQQGYNVYFVADANATSGDDLHNAALITLAHGFAYVLDTEEMIILLGGENG
jgi:nicotinamidase-related amidase